jgi:hypothetical protein
MADRPSTWPADHSSRPPQPSSLGSFLSNQRRDVSTKCRAEPTQTLAGRSADPWGHLAWGLAHLIHVSNTPRGDAYFDIWSTSLYNPLKCSNLVPKFLELNKY